MKIREKEKLLNEIIEPLGYCYIPEQDIFSTTIDAWQRNFGYTEAYNYHSHRINLIFDSEPIYFDYNGKTWLIQFWKGQYGINLGGEVGIYYSDSIVPANKRDYTLFKSVNNADMLPICMKLLYKGLSVGTICQKHWWLTIFDLGEYSHPSSLTIDIDITFKNLEMKDAFINALLDNGFNSNSIYVYNKHVRLLYKNCSTCYVSGIRKLRYSFSMLLNKINCKLYNLITKPFYTSLDKALCLYYYLPFVFRMLFRSLSCTHKRLKKSKRS